MTVVYNLQGVGVVGTMGIGKVTDGVAEEHLQLLSGLFNLFLLFLGRECVEFGVADCVDTDGAEWVSI